MKNIHKMTPYTPCRFGGRARSRLRAAFAFIRVFMKTNVYVDAFNLYYGSLKKTPYRWLNLAKLCELLLPHNQIHKIKYFTANVSSRPSDPDQSTRQQVYLRALRTIPNLSIVYGHYLSHIVRMPKAHCPTFHQEYVEVIKTEEKGSDVNIATYLVHDAHLNDFEAAVVVSNDSDLLEPIKLVRSQLGKKVGILNPHRTHPSRVLAANVDFMKEIRSGVLQASQFPPVLQDQKGQFHKPSSW